MKIKTIIYDFENSIGSANYSGWYVGIINDIDYILLGEHKVYKQQDRWII